MKKTLTIKIAYSAIIASLYLVFTLVTFSISGGAIQFRLSEGLCILPLFFVEAPIGLFIGCLLSNLITGLPFLDVIGGSLVTLIAGVLTYFTGKLLINKILRFIVGGLFPVFLNAFILPVIWYFCYGQMEHIYIIQTLFLLVSQTVSVYLVGGIIYFCFYKSKLFNRQ